MHDSPIGEMCTYETLTVERATQSLLVLARLLMSYLNAIVTINTL